MVLEPLVAVGLAANVLQFIHFSSTLVSKSNEIFNSAGAGLLEHQDLEKATDDLIEIQKKVQESCRPTPVVGCLTKDEDALYELSTACMQIGDDLLSKLNNLKVSGPCSRWKSFRKALKSVCGKEAVDQLAWRLKTLQEEMNTRILVQLRETIDANSTREFATLEELMRKCQQVPYILSENHREVTRALHDQDHHNVHLHGETIAVIQAESKKTTNSLLRALDQGGMSKKTRTAREAYVLNALKYETIDQRQEGIDVAHKDTFEWIYRGSKRTEEGWPSFQEWLRHDNDIYWVTGKAGSGKSTLMKFLYNDSRTNMSLHKWTGQSRLVVAGFFFWSTGSELQKSMLGLLRSLLRDILFQCRELVSIAFPDIFNISEQDLHLDPFWTGLDRRTVKEHVSILSRVFSQDKYPIKYCLLIDGLDEFKGDYEDMATILKNWTKWPSVKICVSSRPLIPFEQAFETYPSLMLQNLTHDDIRGYVQTKFAENKRFEQLQCEEPVRAPFLQEEIVRKASGVFLWVKLVVASLLSGLGNGDGLSDLQQRLQMLPPDLKDLYQHMFSDLDPCYLRQAAKLFNIAVHAEEPLSPLRLSLAEEEDEFVLRRDLPCLTSSMILAKTQRMDKRLKSRTKGLLEIKGSRFIYETAASGLENSQQEDDGLACRRIATDAMGHQVTHLAAQGEGDLIAFRSKAEVVEKRQLHHLVSYLSVDFLHKTVKDFLTEPEVWDRLGKYQDPTHYPPLYSFRGELLAIKMFPWDQYHQFQATSLTESIERCLDYAESLQSLGRPVPAKLLEELDHIISLRSTDRIRVSNANVLRDHGYLRCYVEIRKHKRPEMTTDGHGKPLILHLLEEVLRLDSDTVTMSNLWRLLHYLVRDGRGLDQPFQGGSIWQHILGIMLHCDIKSLRNASLLWFLVSCLRCGADPQASPWPPLANSEHQTLSSILNLVGDNDGWPISPRFNGPLLQLKTYFDGKLTEKRSAPSKAVKNSSKQTHEDKKSKGKKKKKQKKLKNNQNENKQHPP